MRHLLIIIGFIFALSFTSCVSRVVVTTPRARVIKVAPKHHKIVIVKGKRYYYWNGHHYRKTHKGYVIVKV
jgi:uncharacterized protein with PIN domain